MATYSVTTAKHATLAASTVDTVTLGQDYTTVEIYNRSTDQVIYFTTDNATPTVAGDNTYVVGAGSAVTVKPALNTVSGGTATTIVKLISAGTPAYSVTGA